MTHWAWAVASIATGKSLVEKRAVTRIIPKNGPTVVSEPCRGDSGWIDPHRLRILLVYVDADCSRAQ